MSNLEKIIKYKQHLMQLNIQMFSNWISTHSTYWQSTGTNTPFVIDSRLYFEFYYDQNSTTGATTYTMKVYGQYYNLEGYLWDHAVNYSAQCNIGGETFNRSGSVYVPTTNSYNLIHLFTITKTVPCNADGTGKTISYNIAGQANTSDTYRAGATYSFTPPTVQLNAKIGTVAPFTIGTDFNVPVTIYNSNYTHTLNIKIGNTQVATRTITQASTTITFSNSELTAIYNASTNTNTPTFTFDLLTYNGQTQIGSPSSTTVVGTLTNANPTLSNVTYASSTNTLGGDNVISGISNITITCQASGQKSATISNVKVNGQEMTLSNGTYSITLNAQTSGTFNIVATDSRGNTVTQTLTKTLINYVQLTASGTLERTAQTSGEVIVNLNGNYFNGNFKTNTPNTLAISWKYREKGTSTWINGTSITPTITNNTFSITNVSLNTLLQESTNFFDYTKDYEFLIIITDLINTTGLNQIYIVNKGIPIMSWHKECAVVNGDLDIRGQYKQNGQPFNPTFDPLDAMPVGYIYISENSTSPASLFGGTWEAINGRFLVAEGNNGDGVTYNAGSTGGSPYAAAQIRTFSAYNNWYMDSNYAGDKFNVGHTNNWRVRTSNGGVQESLSETNKLEGITVSNINSADKTLPPYLAVYMWRRLPDA